MKYIIYACLIVVCFIVAEVFVVSLVTLSLPNKIDFELLNHSAVYVNLFSISPLTAAKYFLINEPVFIIQRINNSGDAQLWGVYIMPVTIMVWLVFSVFVVKIKRLLPPSKIWVWLSITSVLFILSVFYLRIQACCTESPAWFLDVMILSQVFNPLSSNFWQELYIGVSPWFYAMQLIMLASAFIILYYSYRLSKKNTSELYDHNAS